MSKKIGRFSYSAKRLSMSPYSSIRLSRRNGHQRRTFSERFMSTSTTSTHSSSFGARKKHLALWSANETGAPELNAASLSRRVGFVTGAVHSHYGQSVSHRMTPLHRCPRLALALLFLLRVAALITDGSRVDEQFGTCESHQSCSLRIPLIPAHLHAQSADARVDRLETQVARSEVELLVVGWVVGDVHLAVLACNRAVLIQHHCRIVVESCCTAFEQTCHQHHTALPCHL